MHTAHPDLVPPSRLPRVGTTIFTTMSTLAAQHGAVNLGQGFPDFACDPALVDCVTRAMQAGANQYAPMTGLAALREVVSADLAQRHGVTWDPQQEITITAGATQAIFTALLAIVHPGDEVIVLTPCYDSYGPNITMAGGTVVPVPLTPGTFRPDFDRLAAALTPRTRALVINSPHNPTGTVWSAADMQALAELLRPTSVVVVSDEVYEHMVFDGQPHESVGRWPELAARSFIVSSFGKTLHVTGWKVGYVVAPAALSAEFRKVHQFNVFSVNTAVQQGLADYLAHSAAVAALPAFYQHKRNFFRAGLARTRFRLLPCEGTYFQCVDYADIGPQPEEAFCRWLIEHIGVAAIPLSAFYPDGHNQTVVRFCFAKQEDTLVEALDRLAAL
ncbi:MAG: pyridoxal phosphate-dependent aminotransferase [Pseudomonadota bacterium]